MVSSTLTSFAISPTGSSNRQISVEQIHRSPYRATAPLPGPAAISIWLKQDAASHTVLVRPRNAGGYEILVGEFLWRLAQATGYDTLAAHVLTEVDDTVARQLAALDARQDTDDRPYAVEQGVLPWSGAAKLAIARGIQILHSEQQWSLTKAAQVFGLSRTEGAHYVRVLTLPSEVLTLLARGALSFGQARALSRLAHLPQRAYLLALKIAALPGTPARTRKRQCSVRAVERFVAEQLDEHRQDDGESSERDEDQATRKPFRLPSSTRASGDLKRVEVLLAEHCGFPIQIAFDSRSRSGHLVVRFASVDEFETIAERLAPGINFEEG